MNTAHKKFKEFFASLADIIRLARPVDPFTQQMMYSGMAEKSHSAKRRTKLTAGPRDGEHDHWHDFLARIMVERG